MTNDTTLTNWMNGYLRAWESNEKADIDALFTDDAVYLTAPFDEPRVGRQQIVDGWLEDRDEPGDHTFEWRALVVQDDVGVIVGETRYREDRDYSNLWVMRFAPDGRCREYTEWYMKHPARSEG